MSCSQCVKWRFVREGRQCSKVVGQTVTDASWVGGKAGDVPEITGMK